MRDGEIVSCPWVYVWGSVGDCKGFHYSPKRKTFLDITAANRFGTESARDCGGRLGPTGFASLSPPYPSPSVLLLSSLSLSLSFLPSSFLHSPSLPLPSPFSFPSISRDFPSLYLFLFSSSLRFLFRSRRGKRKNEEGRMKSSRSFLLSTPSQFYHPPFPLP